MATVEQEQREDQDLSRLTGPYCIGTGCGQGLLQGQTPATFFVAIEQSGALPGGVSAKAAAAAVLMTLGVRLSQSLVRALQDSLPPECACLLAVDPDLCAEPVGVLGRQELIERVAQHLGLTEGGAEALTRAVFLSLRARLPSQKIEAIESHLPVDLVHLWSPQRPAEPVRARIGRAAGGWSRPGWPYSL